MLKHLVAACLLALAAMPANAAPAIPCAGDAVVKVPAAIAATDAALKAMWLDQQPNWYTAFEARPPKRNIFDKATGTEPPLEIVKGTAWVQGLYCIANVSPDGNEVLVRYFARVAAFYEGDRWSRPFTDGLLQAYLVRRATPEWRLEVVAGERTILLPNTVKTRPALADIPPLDATTGIPCRTGAAWDGRTCATVARAQPKAR